ncbi:MAG: hypothetical protein HYS17_01985 [Micavibrio aeruginosavorus]|uniref:Uncharacterized protein n=1 Tax=Micavibrio aeruginosavorus TaxID=349221 RepID=A0A7T5R347_9BACT|nr:MAG: hypothetical protein HYS17_01985 [Micavibrio aeruginosavorus]
MSSDQSQTKVGGTAASIGQVGAREGSLSAAQKRAAVDNASVAIRLKDDKGEALDAALTDSNFTAKSDGDLKNLSGADLLNEMINNPLMQAKSGTAWAQAKIAQAGLDDELDKLIEGAPIVEERQCHQNIQRLLAAKSMTEMSPIQVKFLQQNLQRLGLYDGEIDGDFSNKGLVSAVDRLATSEKVIERAMKGGIASLAFAFAGVRSIPAENHAVQFSGEKRVMDLFRADAARATQPATPAAVTQDRRPQQSLQLS